MPKGRRCRTLTPSQIQRLEKFRRRGDVEHPHGFTYPQLKLSMNGSFKLDTLIRAAGGKPIWEAFHAYIVEWLDRFVPERPIVDGKALAAGGDSNGEDSQAAHTEELAGKTDEAPELNDAEKEAATARTVRGSR